MRIHRIFATLVLIFSIVGPACAQQRATEISSALRAKLHELLSYQCGVAEVEDRFRRAVAEIGRVSEPVFINVLRSGAPADIRKAAEQRASSRYDRRQAWLSKNGEPLFGADTKRLAERSRAAYVADELRRLDTLYRGNAMRGLGIVGGGEAAAAVQEAATRYPDLAILGNRAQAEIRRRQ